MTPVTRLERIYFGAVALLAAWVGFWGYALPSRVEHALPFLVPPLHARFLGAMYLSGVTFTVGCMIARRWESVRVVVPMIAIWTGMLFVVSLLHTDAFDFDRNQTRIWFAAYLLYPLIAALLAYHHRGERQPAGGAELPEWAVMTLLVQGAVSGAVGLALLLAPGVMADAWPWPTTTLVIQIYSAPFLSLAAGSLLVARERSFETARVPLARMLVFALASLAASTIHRTLFDAAEPAVWLWFGGFGLMTAQLGLIIAGSLRTVYLGNSSGILGGDRP
jgi:hypothetical protein